MAEITDQQAANSSRNHVVIDVVEAAAEAGGGNEAATAATPSSCVVCMEPMEWVTVAPCGHSEVCVRCAACIRFVHNDRRCCICRTHCATDVVTRADAVADRASAPAAALGGQGLAAGVYWYHGGMGAYFDDLSQYEEMSKVCVAAASTSSEEGSAAGAGGGVRQQPPAAASLNALFLNVVSAPPARQADADDDELSCCQELGTFLLLLLAFAVLAFGLPMLYSI